MEHSPVKEGLDEKISDIPSGYVKIATENGPFIVDLPIKNGGSFHGELLVYQRVNPLEM